MANSQNPYVILHVSTLARNIVIDPLPNNFGIIISFTKQ